MTDRWSIIQSDVLEALRAMPDASFDAVLCDPPYGLGPREPTSEEIADYILGHGGLRTGGDFMGSKWQIPPVAVWREIVRVLRPGAPALIFSGARTFDLMGIGVRAGGLECDDTLLWLYGEAMPKPSTKTDVYIDGALGVTREVAGERTLTGNAAVSTKDKGGTLGIGVGTASATVPVTVATSDEAKRWDGYGHALRPSHEPIILAHKPSGQTIAATCIEHGVGAINVKGCRLGTTGGTWKIEPEKYKTIGVALAGSADGSLNGGVKEATGEGRWPPNLLMTHHPECVQRGRSKVRNPSGSVTGREPSRKTRAVLGEFGTRPAWTKHGDADGMEVVATFDCHHDCPVRMLDESVGDRPSTLTGRADADATHANPGDNGGASSFGGGNGRVYADRGGPSRFMYTSKVSPAEREMGCEHLPLKSASDTVKRKAGSVGIDSGMAGAGRTEGYRNHHKTLKPIAVTRWLATMLLPPPRRDGRPRRILVPYSGAGSEMIGALRAGWDEIVGIERDAEYVTIARARIARWLQVRPDLDEAEAVKSHDVAPEAQASLFGGPT